MIIMQMDGSLQWSGLADGVAGQTRDTIEVSANLLGTRDDLIDQVFAFAFDVLRLNALEIRVHAAEPPTR